ncbi:MAG: Holliday junction resolvase RuvX [Hyphomicrobiaceae bacterium]
MTGDNLKNQSRKDAIFDDLYDFSNNVGHGRLLGIDLGTKTIGIALSDELQMIASPLLTIKRQKLSRDVEALEALIAKHTAVGIILGLPRHLDGREGSRAQSTRAFARNVRRTITLPIMLWDERLTTTAAERALLEADASRSKRTKVIDQVAATLILQMVLDALVGTVERDR